MSSLTDKERILIVNDDPRMRELLQRHLCSQGYEVVTTSSMSEATCVLAARPIDLVITDLEMAKGSEHDLVKYLRENFNHTEVMIVTGYAAMREAVATAQAGAAEYLVKPFRKRNFSLSFRKLSAN
ncbi:MAG: response regulator [bacterium]